MNFQIAAQGRSFKGAMAYYTHDKSAPGPEAGAAASGPHPSSSERVIVNRVSPEDGRMAKIDPPKVLALDRWANEYEKSRGVVVSTERAAKYERVAEKQRQYPDPEARRTHVAEKAAGRAQAAQERQEAASEASSLSEARKAAQGGSERPQSQAAILREISAATKARHRQEWVALRGGYAAQKGEIASDHKVRTQEVIAAHKRETKGEWAAQFRGERDGARERQRMERGLVGRVSLSIAAAREQGGSFAKLVEVNFLSKERRESAIAAASQWDRAALSERLSRELGGKLEPLKAGRAFEMLQALERFKEERSALVERQAGEWGRICEAWKQVGREKAPERGREVAQERGRDAEAQQASRFGWLDLQAAKRDNSESRQQVEWMKETSKSPKFDWLDRQNEANPRKHDRVEQDRDQDW